jgi:hypothetical protein
MMISAAFLMEMQPAHARAILIRPQFKPAMQDRHRRNRIISHLRSSAGVELFRCVISDHLNSQREMIPARNGDTLLRQVA